MKALRVWCFVLFAVGLCAWGWASWIGGSNAAPPAEPSVAAVDSVVPESVPMSVVQHVGRRAVGDDGEISFGVPAEVRHEARHFQVPAVVADL